MSTYADLKAQVLSAIGRDDSVAEAYAEKGLNYGVLSAAILFSPPELDIKTDGAITAGNASAVIDSDVLLREIQTLYNSTDSKKIWLMPKDKFDILTGGLTGPIEFATRHGMTIFFSPTAEHYTEIKVLYSSYPASVTNMAEDLPFINYDSFIVSEATTFSFSCLEEEESAKSFEGIATRLLQVHTLDKQKREQLEEALRSGYNL